MSKETIPISARNIVSATDDSKLGAEFYDDDSGVYVSFIALPNMNPMSMRSGCRVSRSAFREFCREFIELDNERP